MPLEEALQTSRRLFPRKLGVPDTTLTISHRPETYRSGRSHQERHVRDSRGCGDNVALERLGRALPTRSPVKARA